MALEEKFSQSQRDLSKVTDVVLKTKTALAQQVSDVRAEMGKYIEVHKQHERHMDQTLSDSKFWLEKYTDAFKESEKKVAEMQSEFNGRVDTLLYQVSRRVTNDDLKKNMSKMNEMLFIKFRQLEDTKQAVRDIVTYQKHFYPLQMQAIIGEHMMKLGAAANDQPFMQYQQKRYEELIKTL